jgi:hypothetical protein
VRKVALLMTEDPERVGGWGSVEGGRDVVEIVGVAGRVGIEFAWNGWHENKKPNEMEEEEELLSIKGVGQAWREPLRGWAAA